jgi:hypothetical protein
MYPQIPQKYNDFISVTDIKNVKKIYKNKVSKEALAELVETVSKCMAYGKNNSNAWVYFLGFLDKKNIEILENFIDNK